jgi:threonine/homoserine/homoserine lactone efflux protein
LPGALAGWFAWIRWIGVAYRLYLGMGQRGAAPESLTQTPPQPRSVHTIALRGFPISLTNPKTLLFYGAFDPQFVAPDAPIGPLVLLLPVAFLAIAIGLGSVWALAAGRAHRLLPIRGRFRNPLSGGCVIGAGLALAAAHRP